MTCCHSNLRGKTSTVKNSHRAIKIIRLHTIIWFQVFLSNTNNSRKTLVCFYDRVSQNRRNPIIWWLILRQVIFHLSLKKQSHQFREVKQDDKGGNWLTLAKIAREGSWEHFREDFSDSFWQNLSLHPYCQVTLQSTSCQVWDFLPSCWGSLLIL